jgi:hypothetical protein
MASHKPCALKEKRQFFSEAQIAAIVQSELGSFNDHDRGVWSEVRCDPYKLHFERFGDVASAELVFVVGALNDLVIFYDDVEEGFAVSRCSGSSLPSYVWFFQELRFCIRNINRLASYEG